MRMLLWCVQFLLQQNISYDPENLFEDVQNTIRGLHKSGQIHAELASDIGARVAS